MAERQKNSKADEIQDPNRRKQSRQESQLFMGAGALSLAEYLARCAELEIQRVEPGTREVVAWVWIEKKKE